MGLAVDKGQAQRILELIDDAELVLIGASNGFDMAEGLNLFASDDHFWQAYGDLARRDGVQSILQGLGSPLLTPERRWAWQSRFAQQEYVAYEPTQLMRDLRALIGGKDFFVLTCNISGRFVKAGFHEHRVLETEGSARRLVCRGCGRRLPAERFIRADGPRVSEDAPTCPVPACPGCGGGLALDVDEALLTHPSEEVRSRLDTLNKLLAWHAGGRMVALELGVGLRNGAIKRMLSNALMHERRATYVACNYSQPLCPPGFEGRCELVQGDLSAIFGRLVEERGLCHANR